MPLRIASPIGTAQMASRHDGDHDFHERETVLAHGSVQNVTRPVTGATRTMRSLHFHSGA